MPATPHAAFRAATSLAWCGRAFRLTLTEPQIDALLALDARDGGTDPGPTRSLGTWRALRDAGLVRWRSCRDDRPVWRHIEVTEPGIVTLDLLRLAGRRRSR